MRFLAWTAAYLLVETLRRIGLEGTEWARAQVHTIRLKLFKVAARVRSSVRRIIFHFCSSYPWQTLFRQVVDRLRACPAPALESG